MGLARRAVDEGQNVVRIAVDLIAPKSQASNFGRHDPPPGRLRCARAATPPPLCGGGMNRVLYFFIFKGSLTASKVANWMV